jgi:hypothetical protein
MAFKKGQPRPANAGRQKGSQNKSTTIAKEAIAQVAERLGGVDRMVMWAKSDPENESAFWKTIYPRLLPLQLAGDDKKPVFTKMVIEVVRPKVPGS